VFLKNDNLKIKLKNYNLLRLDFYIYFQISEL